MSERRKSDIWEPAKQRADAISDGYQDVGKRGAMGEIHGFDGAGWTGRSGSAKQLVRSRLEAEASQIGKGAKTKKENSERSQDCGVSLFGHAAALSQPCGRSPVKPRLFYCKRRVPMSKSTENNRVLSRMHGRELSAEEVERVVGGMLTHVCTFDFTTCQADGDGCETIPQCP
jgi:hypothetical protein